ncbi:unnamed protein product [Protopolystoma xenopodis]|uniref:Uncharacterized protein n=1 Tax=Protopolystoma xenopodis TaxID=117903 RepID=A0A3S5CUB1_9PLAT|nr:unnamed protein product [Protopolystoma xenopodis]
MVLLVFPEFAYAAGKVVANSTLLQSSVHQIVLRKDVNGLPNLALPCVVPVWSSSFYCLPIDLVSSLRDVFRYSDCRRRHVSSPPLDARHHDNYDADDFGLGAFYMVSLKIRPSCDNEDNPLLPV